MRNRMLFVSAAGSKFVLTMRHFYGSADKDKTKYVIFSTNVNF